MKQKAFKKEQLFALKAMMKGCMGESKEIRKDIHTTSGAEKYGNWNKKRNLGSHARHVALAYAFLRNIPYSKVETKRKIKDYGVTGFGGTPEYYHPRIDLQWILNLCSLYIWPHERKDLTIKHISAWIEEDVLYFQPHTESTKTSTPQISIQ